MSSLIKQHERKSKRHIVYDRIKEEIINHKLEPGTVLAERQLCEALNTSRTPIREALQQLAGEGFVDFMAGNGAIVSSVTYESIIEIYNIREVLEGLACRMCAMLIENQQIMLLQQIHEERKKMIAKKDYLAVINSDLQYHQCIIYNSRNEKLKNMVSNIQEQIKRITYSGNDDEQIAKASVSHEYILEAIKRRDGESAEKLMREHIRGSKQNHINKIKYI